ncbi:MAG: MFS transporter, partial [Hadesarchaea archaeon]|nr:MFS transporter [Hadesarchaea archaeon]
SVMYGKIKSRLSYKMIALIALSLWAVGFTAISQASSSVIIAASVALFGVGQGMAIPATMVWAGETVAIPFRGRIISYLIAFAFIGQFSSTVIFGPVSLSFGLNGVFLMAGVICALLLVISVAMRK